MHALPFKLTACLIALLGLSACSAQETATTMSEPTNEAKTATHPASTDLAVATFGAGCFWCVEAVFARLDGVHAVVSGYMGGDVPDPTYREVTTGRTGHAEVVQITYDPAVIDYTTLLDWLWLAHDPTTLNRQGADVGTQYRSAIFYHSPEQRAAAEASKAKAQAKFRDPIVTEITEASTFYIGEDYHQDYFELNQSAPYSRGVIRPKLRKLNLD
jgi:peptide-methionine (S)-S-oxide reductase